MPSGSSLTIQGSSGVAGNSRQQCKEGADLAATAPRPAAHTAPSPPCHSQGKRPYPLSDCPSRSSGSRQQLFLAPA